MIHRRQFLTCIGATSLLLGWPALSVAATGRPSRLIVVVLRGGLDGLAAVPAYGESQYAALRGSLAIAAPGGQGTIRKLDGTFGLHPRLATCAELYTAGEFAVVHAVAPPYHGRSHFEAQDCLENGTSGPHLARDGWLNRAVAALPGAEGLAIASAMPLLLRGPAPATTWSPSPLTQTSEDLVQRVAALYQDDRDLNRAFEQALQANGVAMTGNSGARGGGARARLPDAMRAAAKFMSSERGPRVVMVQDGGWDTHARQGSAEGLLANKLASLDAAVAAARDALGPEWAHTVVVIATEFGRTVRVNGSAGTDHGTGGVLFLAGGAVRGGRVLGDWRGLSTGALLDGRDLAPTTDLRAVFKGLLRDHLDVPEAALETSVFPESRAVAPMAGLLRA